MMMNMYYIQNYVLFFTRTTISIQRELMKKHQVIIKCGYKAEQNCTKKSHNSVGCGTCQGRERHAALGVAEIARVDRHGLCPTEAEDEHREKSDGIKVLGGIERQSAEITRGGIAAFPCHEAVRGFVEGEREEDNGKGEQDIDQNICDAPAAQKRK